MTDDSGVSGEHIGFLLFTIIGIVGMVVGILWMMSGHSASSGLPASVPVTRADSVPAPGGIVPSTALASRTPAPLTASERAAQVLDAAKSDCAHPSSARLRRLVRQYPDWSDATLADVTCRIVSMRMTAEQLRATWGRPETINRTVTAAGTSEQWVYGSTYIYLEDGIVTSWQDSR